MVRRCESALAVPAGRDAHLGVEREERRSGLGVGVGGWGWEKIGVVNDFVGKSCLYFEKSYYEK